MFKDKKAHERIDNLVRIADEEDQRIRLIEKGNCVSTLGFTLNELASRINSTPTRLEVTEDIRQAKQAINAEILRCNPQSGEAYVQMLIRQNESALSTLRGKIAALENMVTLLVGALGKEFVEEPEVPAVPAVPARMVVRDLPKAKR